MRANRNIQIVSIAVVLFTIIGLSVTLCAVSNDTTKVPASPSATPHKSAARAQPSTAASPTVSPMTCVPKDHFCIAVRGLTQKYHVQSPVKTTLGSVKADAYDFGNISVFAYKPLTDDRKEAVRADLSWGWNPQETKYAGHFAIKTHIIRNDDEVYAALKVYYKGKVILFIVSAPKGMKQAEAAINSLRLT